MPSWRWMMFSGTLSRASAWAWRSWYGANRRLTPARAASRRNKDIKEEVAQLQAA